MYHTLLTEEECLEFEREYQEWAKTLGDSAPTPEDFNLFYREEEAA